MLREKINLARTQAMREGNKEKTTCLGTLLGELDLVRHRIEPPVAELTDAQVITVIQKMISNNQECITGSKDAVRSTELKQENEWLSIYLPQELTEVELATIITRLITVGHLQGPKAMGEIMNYLKQNHAGRYDGKIVGPLVKKLLGL